MLFLFYETPFFTRRVTELMDDEMYRHLQNTLLHEPTKGEVMRDCGGIRKIRLASVRRGKGKRGGLRVIYLHIPEANCIYFITVTVKMNGMTLTPRRNDNWRRLPDKSRKHCCKSAVPKRIELWPVNQNP